MYNETKEAMEKIFNRENPLFLKKEDKFGQRKEVQYFMTVPNYEFDEKDMRVYIVWAQSEDEALGMVLKYEKKEGGWYKVRTSNGAIGYTKKSFTDQGNSKTAAFFNEKIPITKTYNYDTLTLSANRRSASTLPQIS